MNNETRNYVAAWHEYSTDQIVVLERDSDGKAYRKRYNPPYYFYIPVEDGEKGQYTSIFGDELIRAEFDSKDQYEAAKRKFNKKFESDISPLKRVLMDEYYGREAPIVNYAFLDIEVDYAQKIGFAGPTNPYAIMNAITIWQSWSSKFLTYVVPPLVDGIRWTDIPGNNVEVLNAAIAKLIEEKQLRENCIPEIVICRDELELIQHMLRELENADIISGWNSSFYDMPYIIERLLLAGGEQLLAKLEYPGVRLPRKEMVDRFGSPEPVYRFTGKSHLDYMELFKKFTFEGRVSYALGNILQEEVGIGKLDYNGTLEELYHNDFPLFCAYNFRDVDGLVQLDEKFKFIALANQMAHENTVNFDAVLGTVSYVETGIANHAHNILNLIVHDKVIGSNEKVEGAIVMSPWVGVHEWVGSVDINSLYPNVIRALNISPEKIIGQFASKEEAWKDIRDEDTTRRHCLIMEDGSQEMATGEEWRELLIDQRWAVSAYGTVFDQSGARGVVADILGFWYTERKRLQAEKKKYAKLAKEETDPIKKAEYTKLEERFDLLQLTKKISMNSLYGALLNVAFRFGDERMGASVTSTGRATTAHMICGIGKFLTGNDHELDRRYDPEKKEAKFHHQSQKMRDGRNIVGLDSWDALPVIQSIGKDGKPTPAMYRAKEIHKDGHKTFSSVIIYGDTDSTYYICGNADNKDEEAEKQNAIKKADDAAHAVNESFPEFMRTAFLCQPGFDGMIKAGREIVARRAMFQAKKKYMAKVIDLEGFSVDKLKTQGSEIKKADTPKIIQKFLKTTVDMILDGRDYDEIAAFVNDQRKAVLKNKLNVFALGVAKQVNDLDKYTAEYNNPGTFQNKNGGKLTITGHARAACNYNFLLNHFDKGAKSIRSGDKVLIFYLKQNQFKFDSIAFPAESTRFPQWFTENFTVDIKKTEDNMFDSKLSGIFRALGKDVPSPQSVLTNSILDF